jgi:hemerythrin
MTRLQDPFYTKFLADHRELHRLVKAIEDRLTSLAQNAGEPTQSALTDLLADLLVRVKQHFAEEEAGGVLEEAASRLPRLAAEADAVERQHEPLLRQLEQIVQEARGGDGKDSSGRALADAFGRFAHALRAHEAAENGIAEEAFGDGYEE